jgi:hypothetical protein
MARYRRLATMIRWKIHQTPDFIVIVYLLFAAAGLGSACCKVTSTIACRIAQAHISTFPLSPFVKMRPQIRFASCFFLFGLAAFACAQNTGAPSDSPQDGVNSQSSYLGGDHNIDPSDLANFTQIWNATFNPDEKVQYFLSPISTSRILPTPTPSNPPLALGSPSRPHALHHWPTNRLHCQHRKPDSHLRRQNRRTTQRTPGCAALAYGPSILHNAR